MCRLIGFASTRNESIAEVIGEQQCRLFQDMSRLHCDGWGTMWADDSANFQISAARAVTSGIQDLDLHASLIDRPSRARVVHLRLASKGMPVLTENTHPYLGDGMGFAHNGAIIPTGALRGLLDAASLEDIRGNTDSELYFALIRQYHRAGGALADATISAVRAIRQLYPTASLNALILSQDELIAVHASSNSPIPHEELAASGILPEDLPLEHSTDYYRMGYYRPSEHSIAFSSVGIEMGGWSELPHESVTTVGLRSLEITTALVQTVPSLSA